MSHIQKIRGPTESLQHNVTLAGVGWQGVVRACACMYISETVPTAFPPCYMHSGAHRNRLMPTSA